MRRLILLLAIAAGSVGSSSCYSEITPPSLTYTGVSSAGFPTYYDGSHGVYWQNRNGGWFWWSYNRGAWIYAPGSYYRSYPYHYYPY